MLVAGVVAVGAAVAAETLVVVVTGAGVLGVADTATMVAAGVMAAGLLVCVSNAVITTGAESAAAVVVAVMSVLTALATAGVSPAGVARVVETNAGVEAAGAVAAEGLETNSEAETESEPVPPPPPPHAAREVATRVARTWEVTVLDRIFMSIYSELRSLVATSGSSLLASGINRY